MSAGKANQSRCLQPSVAEGLLHGRLASDEFAQAVRHAASCPACLHLLFASSRPASDVADSAMDAVQDRLTAWRAARRAPLMPAAPWRRGHEVDRYVIIRSVGGTEDGVVYEAFDPEREERVVVKQLDLHVDDPGTPALLALAQRLGELRHPNLLALLAVGVHDGFVFFVYEFVKGTTLLDAGGGDPHQILAWFADAGRGLAAAHDAGIAHGCFSPASCVVGRDGRVKVLDFGVGEARIYRLAAARDVRVPAWVPAPGPVANEDSFVGFVPGRHRPPSGQFESLVLAAPPAALGPRRYAAPELVLGVPPSPAADQFALCAALWSRLYGQAPYPGETIALWLRELLKGRIAQPPTLSGVSPAVQAALLRGLERDPAGRFARMSALIARLAPGRTLTRSRALVAAAAGAALVAGGAIAVTARTARPQPDAPACDPALAGWTALWSPARQDALARTAGPAAAESVAALRTRLDGWLAGWRTATDGFCRLPAVQPADCAARARAAAGDLLQLVEAAPSRLVVAASALEALPSAAQCASPTAAQAPLTAIQADVRRRLGLLDDAEQRLAQPADDPVQRGHHALVRGRIALDRGDILAARRLFEDAVFAGAATRPPGLAAAAALERVALSCSAAERALWTGYLDAQVHLTGQALPALAYRGALAQSLSCEGRLSDAVRLRKQVVDALRGDRTSTGAAALLALARAHLAHGEAADAEPVARSAAAIYAQAYGSRHPLVLAARLTVAEAELASAAPASTEQAIARILGDLGERKEPDALRAQALLVTGELARARGRRDEAIPIVQRAVQEYEAALGGTHPALATALLAAGDLLLAAGRDPEAEISYRQVAAIYDTLGQSDAAHFAHARAGVQLARWGNHPPADASELLAWGLAPTGDAHAVDPAVTAWIAGELGRRADAGGQPAVALRHHRAAAAAWQLGGDRRGLASALSDAALLAARLGEPDARDLLERALKTGPTASAAPRLEAALARLLWASERERARSLARSALAALPDSSRDASELRRWLARDSAH